MDDVMRRVLIGGEREKVGHVGFWRVVTSLVSIMAMSPVKSNIVGGVSDVTSVENVKYLFFN